MGSKGRSGFTLIEILVVIVVIALLATLVAPNVFQHVATAKDATARSQIDMLGAALDAYRLDNGRYPSTDQGLDALWQEPRLDPLPRNWRGLLARRRRATLRVHTHPLGRADAYATSALVKSDRSSRDEIVRGYEIEEGRYVVVTDEELEALEPRKWREIDLQRFVDADEIDPMYFQRAYFLTPAGESAKAYLLLVAAMERAGKVGIATFVMRGKEYLVAIIGEGGILRAETLRFHDEVRSPADVGLPERSQPDAERVRAFEGLIDGLSADRFDPEELTTDTRSAC